MALVAHARRAGSAPRRADARARAASRETAICLLVAGALRATLPGPDFTLAWEHSVEKIAMGRALRRSTAIALRLVEARVGGSGAGMEAAAGATLADGAWTWRPAAPPLPELRLTYSTFTRDYRLAARDALRDARRRLPAPLADGDVVTVRACD